MYNMSEMRNLGESDMIQDQNKQRQSVISISKNVNNLICSKCKISVLGKSSTTGNRKTNKINDNNDINIDYSPLVSLIMQSFYCSAVI